MAATIIPIAATALSTLAPIIFPKLETWIQHAEDILGPSKGTDKMDLVTQFVRAVSAKVLPPSGAQPTDDSITGMIEAVFQQMKTGGDLKAPKGTPAVTNIPNGASGGPMQVITVSSPILLLPKAGA